jgi:DNA-binding GntR family transcriptional regulator
MPETYASHSEILNAVVEHDTDRACATLVRDFQESFGPVYEELLKRQRETGERPVRASNVAIRSVVVPRR